MTNKYWVLEDKTPKLCQNSERWKESLSNSNRIVATTKVDGLVISTVFVGIDLGTGEDKPLLFETGVVNRRGETEVYGKSSTWEEAQKRHNMVVAIFEFEYGNG